MAHCINCGTNLPIDAKFCPNCANPTDGSIASSNNPIPNQYPPQKKKGSKKKIIGITIGIIIIFFVIIAIAGASVPKGSLYKTDPENIQGISQFVVLEQGSSIQARFSLTTNDNAYATSDGSVQFKVLSDSGTELYSQNFEVKASDFAEYELKFTGQPFIAYAWFLDASPSQFGSGIMNTNKAHITFTLPDGKAFSATESFYVS